MPLRLAAAAELWEMMRPVIALLLVEDEDALLAALGHDNCVPAQHCERCGIRMVATPDKDVDNALIRAERAEAERDRMRDALHVLLGEVDALRAYSDRLFACEREGCPTEGCDDHDPQYVWGYVGRVERAGLHARAALDGEDTA